MSELMVDAVEFTCAAMFVTVFSQSVSFSDSKSSVMWSPLTFT